MNMQQSHVIIKDIDGNSITIRLFPHISSLKLKRHLSQITKIPIHRLNVIYQGKILKNDGIYTFNNNDVIHISNKLPGGIPISGMVTVMGGPVINMNPVEAAQMAAEQANDIQDQTKNFIQRIVEWIMTKFKYSKEDVDKIKVGIQHKSERFQDLVKWAATFTKTAAMMARFYPLIIVALIILAFFGKPLEYIMLFIAAIVVSILWVIIYILGLPVVRVIPYIPYNLVMYAIPYVLYSVIILTVFAIVSLFCLILAFFNWISEEKLQHMILCQNSPEAWYQIPSYHLDNIYKRSFFCVKPCGSRYEPDGDDLCKKMYKYQPAYCPPAEIMRMYTKFNTGDRVHYFKEYNQNDIKYLMKSPPEREKILKDHYLKQVKFLDKCSEPMKQYKDMTLNICSNLDTLEKNKIFNPKEIKRLREVCYQGYCNSSSNYPFCSSKANSSDIDMSQLVKQICKILAIVTIFIILIIFTLVFIYKKND
jgi:hypothetical protein